MKVKKFQKNSYDKLIKYACTHCNKVLFYKNNDFSSFLNFEIKEILSKEEAFSKKREKDIYGKEDFNTIGNICINKILNDGGSRKYPLDLFEIEQYIQRSIGENLLSLDYDKTVDSFLAKNKVDFLNRKIIFDSASRERKLLFTEYYFKCSGALCMQLLKDKTSIYDWIKPNLEDLCFFKDDKLWLYSVAHEEYCLIYCENEEEYEFLKSIGIEFENNSFSGEKEKPIF